MIQKIKLVILVLCLQVLSNACNQKPKDANSTKTDLLVSDTLSWAERMTLSQMYRNGDSLAFNEQTKSSWNYDKGTYLRGIQVLWEKTNNPKYYNYIKQTIDSYITPDGDIKTYKIEDYNLDQVNSGKLVLLLYQQTKEEKYKKAAELLRKQLDGQPRTKEGGFWHKKRYPYQMWLDGLYMGAPFYAGYSKIFDKQKDFDDIANQFIWMEAHTRDAKTGLLYHAWDESKAQKWADPVTGCSPSLWNRSIGWYVMALVDALDFLPENHPKRQKMIDILKTTCDALIKVQDPTTGVWYLVLDLPPKNGNYLEASASAMYVYAMAKGIRKGYLDKSYLPVVEKAFHGLIKTFIVVDNKGIVTLTSNCKSAGLGGDPYRDGTLAYYASEPIINNDLKGVGPFIMASVEAQNLGIK